MAPAVYLATQDKDIYRILAAKLNRIGYAVARSLSTANLALLQVNTADYLDNILDTLNLPVVVISNTDIPNALPRNVSDDELKVVLYQMIHRKLQPQQVCCAE